MAGITQAAGVLRNGARLDADSRPVAGGNFQPNALLRSDGLVAQSWRQELTSAVTDGCLLVDPGGLTVEVNRVFADMVGIDPDAGPYRPPYPWWPTEEEDPVRLHRLERSSVQMCAGEPVSLESTFRHRDRHPVAVGLSSQPIEHRLDLHVLLVRDIGPVKQAQARRSAAVEVSREFANAEDLETVVRVAEFGFSLLFEGGSDVYIRIKGHDKVFSAGSVVTREDLPRKVAQSLAGTTSSDTLSLRPGILLVPHSGVESCRAWIEFTQPRRISTEEMIVADLLAQVFASAVDRILSADSAAEREVQLERAMESHRLVGQAVGVLVERHHLTQNQAFARLRKASQNRNLKLRELALRILETGLDPKEA